MNKPLSDHELVRRAKAGDLAAFETLGLSQGTVEVRLLRALLQLRERLTQACGDPAKRLEPPMHDDHT